MEDVASGFSRKNYRSRKGVSSREQERQHVFVGQILDGNVFLDRTLGRDLPAATAAAGAADDDGRIGGGIERELDVVLAARFGGEPHRVRWREDLEAVALGDERRGHGVKERNGAVAAGNPRMPAPPDRNGRGAPARRAWLLRCRRAGAGESRKLPSTCQPSRSAIDGVDAVAVERGEQLLAAGRLAVGVRRMHDSLAHQRRQRLGERHHAGAAAALDRRRTTGTSCLP